MIKNLAKINILGARIKNTSSVLSAFNNNLLNLSHLNIFQAFYTTNAGGVFRLEVGDRIAIGVDPTHLTLISYAESTTFFGAYMI